MNTAVLNDVETPTASKGGERRAKITLLVLMWYQGLTIPLLGVVSPWLATRFALSSASLAKLYAAMSASALLTFGIARLVDRAGRKRVVLGCLVGASVTALGAAYADSVLVFAACELLRFSMIGALASSAVALLAESAPDAARRAARIGEAGMAAALGGASLLVVVPLISGGPNPHRAAYLLASGGLLLVPALYWWVHESRCWERERRAGRVQATSVFGVFGRRWWRRSVPILGSSLLGGVEGAAVGGWSYYYGVTVLGVSARAMSAWSLAATAAGFVGFRAGSLCAERFGRVRTVVLFGLAHQVAALWLYLGPLKGFPSPALWLGLGLCLSGFGASASGTAKSTAGVELFPTRLRGTMMGWNTLCGAVATGCTNLLVAVLVGPLGSLSLAIALLSLSGVVGLAVFGRYVLESRDLPLDSADELAAAEAVAPAPTLAEPAVAVLPQLALEP